MAHFKIAILKLHFLKSQTQMNPKLHFLTRAGCHHLKGQQLKKNCFFFLPFKRRYNNMFTSIVSQAVKTFMFS
jgi:hypothetical protein